MLLLETLIQKKIPSKWNFNLNAHLSWKEIVTTNLKITIKEIFYYDRSMAFENR